MMANPGGSGTLAMDTVNLDTAIDSIALESVATPPDSGTKRVSGNSASAVEPSAPYLATTAMVGHQIGRYLLLEYLGSRSTGSVYRAVCEEESATQVIVRLFKRGLKTEKILDRFKSEVHIQAALGRHPGISPMVEAGTTADGWPYLIREYVEGQPIIKYCNSRCLDVAARVRLFSLLCCAIQFAHRHGVIHADLKPEKILVTADGVPKVIDFGLARLLELIADDDLTNTEIKSTPTRGDELGLTPEYTSPEQVAGEVVTTATDVYALGVVLYQLLTGRWPYRITSLCTDEIFQAICEQVAEKPSTVVMGTLANGPRLQVDPFLPATTKAADEHSSVEPILSSTSQPAPTRSKTFLGHGLSRQQLSRQLSGDLDAILLLALRKEPEGRYSCVERLQEDLNRSLKRLPVQARGDSLVYRSAKFVAQHAIVVTAGLLGLTVLVAASVILTITSLRLSHQRNFAEQSSIKARQVVDQVFTISTHDQLFNQPGMHPLRTTLLTQAQRFYNDLLNQRNTKSISRDDLTVVQTRVAIIASLTASATKAVTEFHQAVNGWEKLIAAEPANLDYQIQLAQTLIDLAKVLMSMNNESDNAIKILHRAENLVEGVLMSHVDSVANQLKLAVILQNIAEIQRRKGNNEQVIKLIDRVLAIEAYLAAKDPASVEPRIGLAMGYTTLGQLWGGQPTEVLQAIAAYEQTVELRTGITQEHPELTDQSYQLAIDLCDLSGLQQKVSQIEPAFESLQRAVRIFERICLLYPRIVHYQVGLGSAYNMVCDLRAQHGEKTDALVSGQKARVIFEELIAFDPNNASYRRHLARSHDNLGRLQLQAGEFTAALRSFQHAVDLFESLHELEAQDSYNLACNIALCIPLIGMKNELPTSSQEISKADQRRRQLSGDRAVEALRRSFTGGFLNSQLLQDKADLNSLHNRADFKALVREVEEKPVITGK